LNNLLRKILSIPSFSAREDLVTEFIQNFCVENSYNYRKDFKNNIYITKGKAEYYPCVVAHMDTVHRDQGYLVDLNLNLSIVERLDDEGLTHLTAIDPVSKLKTGIGGDDKCGVYICLKLLEKLDNIKVAFFVEEECGMVGSKNLLKSFFEDVGYVLQFDAPTNNWFSYSCSGVELWSKEFFQKIKNVLRAYDIDNISLDPFTDVVQIRKNFNFCCAVLPAGYYNQHCSDEFVVEEHTNECVKLGYDFIQALGENKYVFEKHTELV
jgi:hypothetical protein